MSGQATKPSHPGTGYTLGRGVQDTGSRAIVDGESLTDSFDIFALNLGKFQSRRRRKFTATPT
jgi:hypothetical protein